MFLFDMSNLKMTHVLRQNDIYKIATPYEGNRQNKNNQMEGQQNQENPFLVKPQPTLSTFGLLKEALKTTCRNGKLSVSILLLVFLSLSQLELGSKLASAPILKDLSSHWPVREKVISFKTPKYPGPFEDARASQLANRNTYTFVNEITETGAIRHVRSSQQAKPSSDYRAQTMQMHEGKDVHSYQRENPSSFRYMGQTMPMGELKDVRAFLGLELLILTISCVTLLFFLVATVSSSYEAYTAKVMSLRDVFLTFRGSWKRPIHTGFCLSLISLGLLGLLGIFIGLISIFAEGSSAYILYVILIISGSIWYFHMAALWMLSLVVSVLESDSSGLKAIDRAGELIKGKRRQAYFLMLLFNFATGVVHMISSAYTKKLDRWAKMVITIPFTIGLICVLKLFVFVAFTVYYHERKMNRKEERVQGRLGLYVPVASGEA